MNEKELIEKIAEIIDLPVEQIANHLTFREIVELLVEEYEKMKKSSEFYQNNSKHFANLSNDLFIENRELKEERK